MKLIATILFLGLILSCTHASKTLFSDQLVAKLKESKMGKIIMGMAELAGVYDSEFEVLINSLNDLAATLSEQQTSENTAHVQDSNIHDTAVSTFATTIMNAQQDVQSTRENLDTVLYPEQQTLQQEIALNIQDIQNDEDAIQVRKVQRQNEIQKYDQVQADLDSAINACQQALQYLNQLKNPETAFIQLTAKQQSLQMTDTKNQLNTQLKKVITKARFQPIIDALAQMADSQIFTNQDMLNQVIDLIENLLANFEDQQSTSQADELAAQDQFNQFLADRQNSISQTSDIQNQNQSTLDSVNQQISDGEDFFNQRSADLAQAQADSETENANWSVKVETHNQLDAQYSNELYIIQQCINALNSRNQ